MIDALQINAAFYDVDIVTAAGSTVYLLRVVCMHIGVSAAVIRKFLTKWICRLCYMDSVSTAAVSVGVNAFICWYCVGVCACVQEEACLWCTAWTDG